MKHFVRFSRYFRSKTLEVTDMTSKRYFINELPDYNGVVHVVSDQDLKLSIQNILDSILKNFKASDQNAEDGIYLGTAGVAYMYYYVSKASVFNDKRGFLLNCALEYIKPALKVASKYTVRLKDVPSFILGNCGIYAVASVLFNAIGDEKESTHYKTLYFDAANIVKDKHFLECGSDELFVGRAGYICGALWLSKSLNIPPPLQELHDICKVMVASGREYSKRHRCSVPLMYAYYSVEYLGAAHGLCSILQMMMSVPGFLESNPNETRDIRLTVDYLLSLQDPEGNFPAATDELNQAHNELVHWCHGAPGVVYLMAKAYILWKDAKYLQSCIKMAEDVWKRGLLKKGPGICHGVAGNGYVFLLMYRLTNDAKYLYRAQKFAQFLETETFKCGARKPDHPYSLYEGIAGTACFLADLINPQSAAFPFFDIF